MLPCPLVHPACHVTWGRSQPTVTNHVAENMISEVLRRYHPLSVHPLLLNFYWNHKSDRNRETGRGPLTNRENQVTESKLQAQARRERRPKALSGQQLVVRVLGHGASFPNCSGCELAFWAQHLLLLLSLK